MQHLRRGWGAVRLAKESLEYQVDRWVSDFIIPIWKQSRFSFKQKVTYNRTYNRAYTLFKLFMLGYLTVNLGSIPLDHVPEDGAGDQVFTEYEILSNQVERDHFEQAGRQRNLKTLFERGKRKGLTQVELFELGKYMELNYLTKDLLHHLEYLQNLKVTQ